MTATFELAHKQLDLCSNRKISHLNSPGGFDQLPIERCQRDRHPQGFLPYQRAGQVGGVIASQIMLNCQNIAAHHSIFSDRQTMEALPSLAELAQSIEEWVIGWYRVSKFRQATTDDNL